jgi:NCS1 family nucleobase:cation symporter-1
MGERMSVGAADGRHVEPESDRVWSIETHGIDPIPDSDRHGEVSELFWVWCAANISVLGLAYGAYLVTFYGLDFWQAVAAAVIGTVASFMLVGFISLAGKIAGAPTLVLSRAAFGVTGNVIPTLVSWIALVGWEIILVALATLSVEAILDRLGAPTGDAVTGIAFAAIAAATIAIGLLGHATIVRIQTWFTYAFAVLTVVFFVLVVDLIDWDAVASLPSATAAWFVGGVSIVAAGLGIGWVNAGADYSRYLPHEVRSRAVVGWTVLGASVPPLILIPFGALLAADNPDIANSLNPIAVLARDVPTWFLVPYLLVAVGGLLAGAVLDIYSSGLNLLTLGVRIPRYQSVAFDGVLMLVGNVYILFFARDFFGPFQGFLITLGVLLAAWAAVFLVDLAMFRWRNGYDESQLYRRGTRYRAWNLPGVIAFLVAGFVGLGLVKSTAWVFSWAGYLLSAAGGADGAVANSSIGLWIAFVVAGALYAVLSWGRSRSRATVGRHSLT